MFSIIAAIGKNRELGKNGKLVFRIKEDMDFFKNTTSGHKIAMGRKTWESLPKKLPNRKIIVISRNLVEGADLTITDISSFIEKNKDTKEEIFIIGGGMIYTEFLKYAKNLYLTEVDSTIPDADTIFPEFNRSNYSSEIIKKGKENDLAFTIVKYTLN